MAEGTKLEEENLAKLDPQSWLIKDPNLKPDARELFEKYSKIAPEDVDRHVTEVVRSPPFTGLRIRADSITERQGVQNRP
jgi:hypothetical protein